MLKGKRFWQNCKKDAEKEVQLLTEVIPRMTMHTDEDSGVQLKKQNYMSQQSQLTFSDWRSSKKFNNCFISRRNIMFGFISEHNNTLKAFSYWSFQLMI